MKHCKSGRQLGRIRKQRIALFRTMSGSLILNGRIVTTEAKAKELKPRIDRIVNKVKRVAAAGANSQAMVYAVQKDIPLVAVRKIIKDLARFEGRNSGYTRIVKMTPRESDRAKMAIIEFV